MTQDNFAAYIGLALLAFLIARNTYHVAAAKHFDPLAAGALTFVGALIGIIPGVIVNLIYRLMKPRDQWSF